MEEYMKRILSVLTGVFILLLISSVLFVSCEKKPKEAGPVTFALWTQESESEGGFQYIEALAESYMAAHANVTIDVLQKGTEDLREDFQTASLAGDSPELLWTVSDHAGPFTTADLILPVDDYFDMSKYVESVVANGKTWAVPITAGNHLMLLYNKDLVSKAPVTTDELIAMAKEHTSGDMYGLVYNQTEPFWLAPWLGGFGGKVFAADGVTPTLDTAAMVGTLQFLHDLKFVHKIMPNEADYGMADTLFKEGKAAFLINGDWSLTDYKGVLGDKLGITAIPKVSSTGKWSAPYTSGKYFMISNSVEGEKLDVVVDFIKFATNTENQVELVEKLVRLPGLTSVLNDPIVTGDPVFKDSGAALAKGTPMPTVLEMRANWDAMKPELIAVMSGTKTPEEAAKAMQAAAEAGIAAMK